MKTFKSFIAELSNKTLSSYVKKSERDITRRDKRSSDSYDKAGRAETRSINAFNRKDKAAGKKHFDNAQGHYKNADSDVKKLQSRDKYADLAKKKIWAKEKQ